MEAKGDLLFFLDDDTIFLSDDGLEKLITTYKPGFFLCGAKRFWSHITWDRNQFFKRIKQNNYQKIRKNIFLPVGINRRKGFRDLYEYSFLSNCGLVAKSDFMKVKGFDEEIFCGWGREDVDLMFRLYLNNVKFINLFDKLSVLHLNHCISSQDAEKRELYFKKYEQRDDEYKRHSRIS